MIALQSFASKDYEFETTSLNKRLDYIDTKK